MINKLIPRYARNGILVDTNILLLFFLGSFDPSQIPRYDRTAQFTAEDYDTLLALLQRFDKIVTTPNILTEVNSLSGQIKEPARTSYFAKLAEGIHVIEEHYVESREAASTERFAKMGLTDAGILRLAKDKYLVLTDDFPLSQYLQKVGVDVINFNHIRVPYWYQ